MISINLKYKNKLESDELNDMIKWVGHSLGLFNLRDKDSSCYRIFIELLKSSKLNKSMSSDEIAYKANLTRGTVIHHIRKLMDSGLIVNQENKYLLRQKDLNLVIKEIKKEMDNIFNNLMEISKKIDENLNLK